MTDKKELNNEELNEVNGGCDDETFNYYRDNFTCKIEDDYNANQYIGEEVVVRYGSGASRGNNSSYAGIFVSTYEKSWGCGTKRTHLIRQTYCSNTEGNKHCGELKEFYADEWDLYVKAYHL